MRVQVCVHLYANIYIYIYMCVCVCVCVCVHAFVKLSGKTIRNYLHFKDFFLFMVYLISKVYKVFKRDNFLTLRNAPLKLADIK